VRRIETRVGKVEAVLRRPPGCSTCRRWDGTVIGDDEGTRTRPEVCPGCERVVPIQTLVIIADVDLERL